MKVDATNAENLANNDNRFPDYGLKLRMLTDSVIRTFDAHGFPFTRPNGATLEQIKKSPGNTKLVDLLSSSLPICDMDAVQNGKHLKDPEDETGDDPIVRWAG